MNDKRNSIKDEVEHIFDALYDDLAKDKLDIDPKAFGRVFNKDENDEYTLFRDSKYEKYSYRPLSRPMVLKSYRDLTFDSRYDYFINYISNVDYRGRGQEDPYRKGHMAALEKYYHKGQQNKDNLLIIEPILENEILRAKGKKNHYQYDGGYYDGLLYVRLALKKSKWNMIDKIAEELNKKLKR
ncbi:hypothetical protein EII25_04405 [Erysipelotrichaceae bacterium OH741_COT-311]|nr:hypothetical protein [Erysipelotrichaceae bacterium]MDO5084814.1 hypothetical protein [Erysipelotrichaceae bacterium]RRC92466.1 hypothetical protein EII25_04405 [Erysipelotrichaceae bacterium OH741_COT-311]